AEQLPDAEVYHAHGLDSEFFAGDLIGRATAAVFSMGDDPKNLYAAILARAHGIPLTVAVMRDPISEEIFELGGVNVAVNPRMETAALMTRYAHDPRIHQIVMLDDDRFEVLDLTMRHDSPMVGRRISEPPEAGVVFGALIRDGEILFADDDAVLQPDDRVIVMVDSERAAVVERAL
ncbi:MAG: NAD-binding protein, partial [Thermoleophilia bacterium]|nr:NAD-binding protein [Thermoleophilia bacterium]